MNSTSPWKYLGWIIWPILDDDTGQIIFYDIHEPGNFVQEYDTLPNVEMARAAIRKHRRELQTVELIDRLFATK